MVDVVALLPTGLTPGSDTPAPISMHGGGSAANTAAWLVAAGVPTTFVGRVGDDALGRLAVDELRAMGLDLAVTVDPGRPTGTCIVLVDADGERTMVPSAGANAGLDPADVEPALFAAEGHLHVSAYALFHPSPRPAVDAAIRRASEAGMSVSVDAASVAPLRGFGVAAFLAWLPRCLLFANLAEALLLSGAADADTAARALGARCGTVVVKLGGEGAVWSDGTAVRHAAAAQVPIVDSTGAGDAFAAGVIAALLDGADVATSLAAGTALAARAIASVGARPPSAGAVGEVAAGQVQHEAVRVDGDAGDLDIEGQTRERHGL